MGNFPYQNPNLTIRERVADLMDRMSLEEKVGQVNQHLYGWECYEKKKDGQIELTDKFKEHVKWGKGIGALYGLFRADPWSKVGFETGIAPEDSWRLVNQVQEYVINQSRWEIPALIVEECPHGHQGLGGISYPTNLGRGNSFNTELTKQSSHLMAQELAAKGVHLALVSTLDLAKDPRWGRTEECFGEDPILAARMSEAVITGFQGDLISEEAAYLDKTVVEINKQPEQIGVVLKHCIAQGEALGGHNSGTVTIGGREFKDIYFPLLKSARNAVGVMAAYNDVDGVPCHINGQLFQKTLREQIGYQGIVMADGIALDRLEDVFDEKITSANAALEAGVDLSLWDETYLQITEGVKSERIKESVLDAACARVLGIKLLLGLFEHPFVEDPQEKLAKVLDESKENNLRVAEESLTLLKNDGLLPLDHKIKKVAVVGPNANSLYALLGDYSAPQAAEMAHLTIFHQIQTIFSESEVVFSEGCEVRNTKNQLPKIEAAVKDCQDADVIICVLGGSSARNFDMEFLKNGAVSSKGINMDSGENVDVASLSLGGQQLMLLKAVKELEKPIVTVLIQGRPYDIQEVQQLSDAVLVGWFPGQAGGTAIARTLIGDNNPNGRLNVSYPLNSQQLPVYYYQRAASKKDDYYDQTGAPLHEFGYGLSYTQFSYERLHVHQESDTMTISVTVKNVGEFTGKETVLVFVRLLGGRVIQRHKQLKAFDKIELMPDESTELTFTLSDDQFYFTDMDQLYKRADGCQIMVKNLSEEVSFKN
ncbi:glycoside hydrolase family 3 C-terminal domain-containing protein [Candidatus Enterococcus murrayae]|uniref:Glycoside hydrolase family 3 C-terminal domain-containing protein n=1 Tax=Candidatus Enterococcus murrayae TaxID=2815321 RepID=A0ABS3HJF8_9ENTE|nr:glycoside hydrolase family 3 N-terminal domain-containing protein [Enterococcus sp. MJM16]MBO0452688.1 glycoside hydrolase family 3 C-terminal domain-containing protein [Enterococcus sp. MJM16]